MQKRGLRNKTQEKAPARLAVLQQAEKPCIPILYCALSVTVDRKGLRTNHTGGVGGMFLTLLRFSPYATPIVFWLI